MMGAADWITLGATIVAAASFVWGVVSWRASYLGQKKIELAEQVYELALTCADHVRAIRSPVGYGGEGSSRKRAENETTEEREIFDKAFVSVERIEARKEHFNKLFSLTPRFEFYFGEGAARPILEFAEILNEIRHASVKLRHYWLRQGGSFATEHDFQNHLTRMQAAEAVFWDGYGDNDPINPRLDQASKNLKRTCVRAVDPRLNLWWALKKGLVRVEEFIAIPPDIRN